MDTIQNKGNYIMRCPDCILIPSIKMKFENNEIEYKCENKHKNTLPYDKFVNESKKYSLNNIKCLNCNNNKSDNDNNTYSYCFKCKNFICSKCLNEHTKIKIMNYIFQSQFLMVVVKNIIIHIHIIVKIVKKIFVLFVIMNIQIIIKKIFQNLYLMRKMK